MNYRKGATGTVAPVLQFAEYGNFPVFVIARSLRCGNPDRNMTIDTKRLDCFAAARNDVAFVVLVNCNAPVPYL